MKEVGVSRGWNYVLTYMAGKDVSSPTTTADHTPHITHSPEGKRKKTRLSHREIVHENKNYQKKNSSNNIVIGLNLFALQWGEQRRPLSSAFHHYSQIAICKYWVNLTCNQVEHLGFPLVWYAPTYDTFYASWLEVLHSSHIDDWIRDTSAPWMPLKCGHGTPRCSSGMVRTYLRYLLCKLAGSNSFFSYRRLD